MKGLLTNTSIGRYGRLANGLFQIAGVIGIARRQGFGFAFPRYINHDHKERFGSTEDIDVHQHLLNPLPEWNGAPWPERHYPWGYWDQAIPPGNWDLRGHFQSEKYFKADIAEVRHYLTFKDEPHDSDYVAVHYRAGDYGSGWHPRCTPEYYRLAMALFPGRRFLLFSDEPAVAQAAIGQEMEVAGGNYLEDFKRMKRCNSFITANSSYSLMAAILADQPGKQIVCPRTWFGPEAGITGDDCYPEGAIVI